MGRSVGRLQQRVFSSIFRSSVASIIIAGLSACGGGSSGGDDDLLVSSASCNTLVFDSAQVSPLSQVRISGLSGAFLANVLEEDQPLYARLISADNPSFPAVEVPLFVRTVDGQTVLDMAIPFNYGRPYEPTILYSTIVAGNIGCDGTQLAVSALDVTDAGLVDEVVSALQTLLEQRAGPYNIFAWEDLAGQAREFEPDGNVLPTGLLINLIATQSVERFIESLDTLNNDDRALFASILNKLGYPDLLAARLAEFQEAGPAPLQLTAATAAAPYASSSGISPLALDPDVALLNIGDACATITGEAVTINDAFDLDYYMKAQKNAADKLAGLGGSMRELGLAATPLVSLASGGLGAGMGALLFIEYTLQQYDSNALPSQFSDMQVDLYPGAIVPEDFELAGENMRWSNARVWAKSTAWNLTGPALEALSQAIGAGRYFKSLGTASNGVDSAIGLLADQLQNGIFNKLKGLGESECLAIPEYSWGPIDISADEWVEDEVVGDTFTLGTRLQNARILTMQKTGIGELVLRTRDGKFGGTTTLWNDFIDIRQMSLTVTPRSHKVNEPGEVKNFIIRVLNTERPDEPLRSLLPGTVQLMSGPEPQGDGSYSVDIATPVNREDYPATLEFYREPVLGDSFDRRSVLALLTTEEEILLTPEQACVLEGDPLILTAELLGFEFDTPLTWRVISGPGTVQEITGSGTLREAQFTSASPGTAIVEVSAAGEAGDITARSTVTIGPCDADIFLHGLFDITAAAPDAFDRFAVDEDRLPAEPFPPQKPAFWDNRTETFSSPVSASGNATFIVDELNRIDVFQAASGFGRVTYAADGVASFALDFEGADQCDPHPVGDTSQVDCSSVDSAGSFNARFYSQITAPTTYILNIDVECTRTGDSWANASIFLISFVRFSESGEALPPNGIPDGTTMPDYVDGIISPFGSDGNICSSGVGSFSHTEQVSLVGSSSESPEEIVLFFTLLAGVGNNHFAGFDLSDEEIPVGTQPTPGSYNGSASIKARVSFYPTTP